MSNQYRDPHELIIDLCGALGDAATSLSRDETAEKRAARAGRCRELRDVLLECRLPMPTPPDPDSQTAEICRLREQIVAMKSDSEHVHRLQDEVEQLTRRLARGCQAEQADLARAHIIEALNAITGPFTATTQDRLRMALIDAYEAVDSLPGGHANPRGWWDYRSNFSGCLWDGQVPWDGDDEPETETEWVRWDGGERPVPPDTAVEVVIAAEGRVTGLAREFWWGHHPFQRMITAYRVVQDDE
jgi:hypothetical protein